MKKTLTFTVLMVLSVTLVAQITFRQAGEIHTKGFHSGVAAMVTDANGDGRDDIIRLQNGTQLTVTLQGQDERFLSTFYYQLIGGKQWNITGGDLDNDGGFDILTSGVYDRVKIFRSVPFSTDFTFENIDDKTFFGQATNLVDINNDGYLDHFVCHDDGASVIFMNDGTGQLVRNDSIIDFTTDPPSDMSGNYGSIWTDIDSDGDLDLYIAKCRIGVTSPADPRRINVLYLNNGDGTFTEAADSFHLNIGDQSWTADFGDIDNDGDLDVFITNHNVAGQLYENIDNAYFQDITASSGVTVEGLSMQGTFRDFDNDGLLDLIVSGARNYLYRNLGQNQFELVASPFSERQITSYGIGDLNSDGFLDVYATYNDLYNDPSSILDDIIWMNMGNSENHYVNFHLIGMQCNRSAVGARLYLFGPWGMQTREVHAGEGYGITNSLTMHFGLGQSESIDSLVIVWPDATREVYTGLDADKTALIKEGGCQTYLLDLGQGPYTQCLTEQFEINAPDGYATYLWSTGDTTASLTVTEPGVYHVSMTDANGCPWIAGPVIVSSGFQIEPSEISVSVDGRLTSCNGDTVKLSGPDGALSYLWNTGDTTETILASTSGAYAVQATYTCKTLTSDTVQVNLVNPNDLVLENDTLYAPGAGVLQVSGDSIFWYADQGGSPVDTGAVYITPSVDSTTTFYVQQVQLIPGEHLTVGPENHTGNTLYNSNQSNGAVRFDVLNRFRLDSVLVITGIAGDRTVLLLSAAADTVYRQTFTIDSGRTYLPLNVWLDPGMDYLLTTDPATNQTSFGGNSPRLYRSDGGFTYPFIAPDVVQLTGTATSQGFYYYFYDWHLTREDQYCEGDLLPVQVVVVDTTTSGIHMVQIVSLDLIPNPASEQVAVHGDNILSQADRVEVLDVQGRRVSGWQIDPAGNRLMIGRLPSGVYMVRIRNAEQIYLGKMIKL